MYNKALQLAKEAHKNQFDKAGKPYLEHLLTVANGLSNDTEKVVALLHDIVEDTEYTLNDLRLKGFPEDVVMAVDSITKRNGESYDNYLHRVSQNPIATHVKLVDLAHNMDLERLSIITEKDKKRAEKYKYAIEFLRNQE